MSPAPEFSSKIVAFLSATAGGKRSKTYRQRGKITLQQKTRPAFRQDARKIACGYFQENGINLVHFAPESPVFLQFYVVATTQNQSMGFIIGICSIC